MAGDLTGILLVGALILGGVYLMQNPQILQGFGGQQPPMEEAPPAQEEQPAEEEPPQEEPQPQPYPVAQPYPVPYPVPIGYPRYEPGLSRRQICRRYFGGSCHGECSDGFWTRECKQCVSYCGPPRYSDPRPRPIPIPPPPRPRPRGCPPGTRWSRVDGKCVKIYGGPGPRPREECPRGQRFDWKERKCKPVPKPPTTPPTTPAPASEPKPTTPPAETAYGYSYYGGWY